MKLHLGHLEGNLYSVSLSRVEASQINLSPPILFNGLEQAGVAEGVATLGDVGLTENINRLYLSPAQLSLYLMRSKQMGQM